MMGRLRLTAGHTRTHLHRWAVLFVLGIAGCGSLTLERPLRPSSADWPAFGGTSGRANASDQSVIPPLSAEWSQDVAGGIGSGSPVVIDSVLLVGNLRGDLYALHVRTGKALGSVNLGEAISGSPIVEGSKAFVALSNTPASLVAYDLVDGKARWRKSYGDIELTPLIYEGKIYLGNTLGSFYCVERDQGELVWKFDLPENQTRMGIHSSPSAEGKHVVFGADDGGVYALHAETGAQRWRFQTDGPVVAPPSIEDGTVVVSSLKGTIYALDLATGLQKWSHPAGAPVYSNALLTRGRAVVCTLGGMVYALDPTEGALLWTTDIHSPMNSGPVAAGNVLYIGTLKKELFGLDVATGEVLWKELLSGRVKSAPAIAYNRIFVATDDRLITAFRQEIP